MRRSWLAPLLASCSDPNDSQLVFLNWQDYIDPTILTDFTDTSGLTVTYETYASNDELSNRLKLAEVGRRRGREGSSFDLIVPSDNLLRQLRTIDLLQEIDKDIVTNIDNLDDAFRAEPFDPGNRFSVPWATGTTGIGYDTTVFSDAARLERLRRRDARGTHDDPRRDARRVRAGALLDGGGPEHARRRHDRRRRRRPAPR